MRLAANTTFGANSIIVSHTRLSCASEHVVRPLKDRRRRFAPSPNACILDSHVPEEERALFARSDTLGFGMFRPVLFDSLYKVRMLTPIPTIAASVTVMEDPLRRGLFEHDFVTSV
jgi:hypothetical protein